MGVVVLLRRCTVSVWRMVVIVSGLNRLAAFLLVIYMHVLVLTLMQVAGTRPRPSDELSFGVVSSREICRLSNRHWPYTLWV